MQTHCANIWLMVNYVRVELSLPQDIIIILSFQIAELLWSNFKPILWFVKMVF